MYMFVAIWSVWTSISMQFSVLGLNQLNSYDMTLFRIICLSFSSIQMIYFELFDFKML